MDFFSRLPPPVMVIIASLFTWSITALGAAVVFLFKSVNKKTLDAMLGLSAGVMIAASFWSLIAPAIDLCGTLGYNKWMIPAAGFVTGGLFILAVAVFLDKKISSENSKGMKGNILLVTSITMHNIPEGLAVGVGFGGFALGIPGCTLISAMMIALGIGIQNFPEGTAVSVPLLKGGTKRFKAFFIGQASGFVEPISAILGYFLTMAIRSILPFLLTFSAGAMIAVVSNELLPDGGKENKNICTLGCIFGFVIMMILDVALTF